MVLQLGPIHLNGDESMVSWTTLKTKQKPLIVKEHLVADTNHRHKNSELRLF